MQIRLSYKLLGIFFLILAIVVGTMMLSQHIFFHNFSEYVRQVESQKRDRLIAALQVAYTASGNWQDVVENSEHWDQVIRKVLGDMPSPPHPGERPPSGQWHGGSDAAGFKGSLPPPMYLLDADGRPIMGRPGPPHQKLEPIEVNGQIAGWVGMHEPPPFISGPPAELLERQGQQFFILGSVVIALTALIAFLFSRYLLRPILRLTHGTRELADRNFSVRIAVSSGDELGQLAENFNAMAQTLDNFEKMRSQWLTDISHEMRTPLAILRGEIEALQDGVRQPTESNLASLHTEVERINKLVEDLHLLSRADSDSLVMNMQMICPAMLLEKIADIYNTRLFQRGIKLELVIDNILKVSVKGDADRLAQVFTNLFENVCKYIDVPGTLKISGHTDSSGVTLCFCDSGPGVSDDALSRLFDRLYRVDPSRSRATGGSGLGLSICRQIIQNHNGQIWAEHSGLGGLTIGIKLPSAAR